MVPGGVTGPRCAAPMNWPVVMVTLLSRVNVPSGDGWFPVATMSSIQALSLMVVMVFEFWVVVPETAWQPPVAIASMGVVWLTPMYSVAWALNRTFPDVVIETLLV